MIQAAARTTEVNPAKLAMLYKRELELCKVKSGDTIALVSDLGTRREYIQATFAAADELGLDAYEMCVNSIPGWTKVGVPTIGKCKGTLDALSAADLIVIFHVPLFARWLKTVMEKRVRVLMIIDAPDDLEQLMAPPGLKEAAKYAEGLYRNTKQVRVVSDAGTVGEIIVELRSGRFSNIAERSGRAQDKDDGGGLETLRRDGYM